MKRSLASTLLFACLALSLAVLPARADTATDLQKQIDDKNAALHALQAEITQYEQQLTTIGSAKKTLEAEIKLLDTSRKKLSADISVTQNRIATASLTIEELAGQITDKGQKIDSSLATIGASLRAIGKLDEVTVAEHFLSGQTFTAAWQDADRETELQSALSDEVGTLGDAKTALEENQAAVVKQQDDLVSYKKELAGQKVVLDQNRATQATVLTETKNKESNYQGILDQKKAAAEVLQNEINSYESQLKYTFDPTTIPSPGSGVLAFPLDPAFMAKCPAKQSVYKNIYCITQYFGSTSFAQSGAYNGAGHNGIDIGAPTGTKVVAALSGTVLGTGNTDLVRGCYSFGKWVMIKHDNGLASIYAHLSYIGVTAGQKVAGGEFLGLSGQTGYATGPHLHFGLYVADAVKVVRLGDIKITTNCGNAVVPIAPTAAYLNPIQYL
jgi:murein DD-endopeptidase MepM/ murein hydrolase activator NlpD